ncbi:MAG: hypothetical protein FJ317_06465, partial [SAR202 cluster bacterium]|nr:hypothetical protein [SAR202 cluster bacterium]
MSSAERYPGFPKGVQFTPVPNPLLGPLLQDIDDLMELKVALRVIWHLGQKRRAPRAVTMAELGADAVLIGVLGGGSTFRAALRDALGRVVARGILAEGKDTRDSPVYALNTEAGRQAVGQTITAGVGEDLDAPEPVATQRSNIFVLYEDNIGTLSPLIAEELREAEKRYPAQWVSDAFKEAV